MRKPQDPAATLAARALERARDHLWTGLPLYVDNSPYTPLGLEETDVVGAERGDVVVSDPLGRLYDVHLIVTVTARDTP